ncbi:MAG TPA: cytochrome c, partial [Terriglobales bacterium]
TTLGKQLKAPDLRSPAVQKQTDAALKAIISTGKGNMPAFQNQFSEKEIDELVAHLRILGKAK